MGAAYWMGKKTGGCFSDKPVKTSDYIKGILPKTGKKCSRMISNLKTQNSKLKTHFRFPL